MCIRDRRRVRFDRGSLSSLIRFGTWTTISNLVGPLMVYLDRFLIGGMVSMAAVAYYVTPYEVVTKLWVVPAGLLGVLFPAFATSFLADREHTSRLFRRSVRLMLLVMFPVTLVLVAMAPEGLRLWLGSEFAANSTVVLRWLAIGVFVNCVAQVPYTALQGIGRPDLTAKLHLLELPAYLLLLWVLVGRFGIEGAAGAWVLRIGVDAVALFTLASRPLMDANSVARQVLLPLVLSVVVLCIPLALSGPGARALFTVAVLATFLPLAWTRAFDRNERAALLVLLRRRPGGSAYPL